MATAEYQDPRGEFAVALKAAGLLVEDGPVMDGQLHRVRVEGARPGTRDGSYVGHLDGKPSGYIENFKTGHKENWSASEVQLTAAERAESIAQMQRARAHRAAELAVQHSDTAERVGARWESLADVPPAGQNAYLSRKGAQAHGVKFDGEHLVVPLRDVRGKLWSLQDIPAEEGAPKMFERGGRKAGNMHVIGEIKAGVAVLVAEGYATGASLHQATGRPVAVAFDAGNLDAVVGALKQRHPTSAIFIMGDNDRSQEPNVGYEKATAAAHKHGVAVAFPQFHEPGKWSDFNDLHVSEGLAAVRAQVEKALGRLTEQTRAPAVPEAVPPRDAVAAGRGVGIAPEPGEHTILDIHPDWNKRVRDRLARAGIHDGHDEAEEQRHTRDQESNLRTAGSETFGEEVRLEALDRVAPRALPEEVAAPAHSPSRTAPETVAIQQGKADSQRDAGEQLNSRDVASVAASVATTTVGGPAVQLGAQAIAGVSAIDAGQRALTPAEAKLKEPEIAAVATAVAAIDTANRTAQRQEGVNTIERVAQRETELDATKRQRSEPPLEDRFNVVTRFARGRDYHFRDQPGKIAFKERWLGMQTSSDAPAVVKAMLDRAQERDWKAIRIRGSEEFQRQVWIAATARGIKAVGYEPTPGDRAAVGEERARLSREEVKSPTQTLQPRSATRPSMRRDQAPERPAAEPSLVRRSQESASPQKPPAQAADKPIAGPLRSFLTDRGVAAAEVDATVAVASERMQQGRVYVGQVVSHGADHYEFDKKNGLSFYVKLQTVAGEKVIWGVDLRRALTDNKIKVGESVAIEHSGMQPVTIVVKDRDASGNVIGEHEEGARRNTWHAVNVDQLRREAMKAPDLGPAKPGTSAEPAVDVPAQARTARTNRHEAQVLQALEKAFDTKNVPEELRPAARAVARRDLDVRLALGKPVKVAIYDPEAPSREAQRTVQLPQRQSREHQRRR